MKRPLRICAVGILLATASPALAETAEVSASVLDQADGTRTLVHETVIEAPVETVWATLSTAEGWKMWGPKFASFDLRNGGSIETGYHEGAAPGDPRNIRHRILAFVPERLIALRVEQVPEGGPVSMETLSKMWGVYELEDLGEGRTRLRISGIGYGRDEASSQMLEFFKAGNVYSIDLLRKNLVGADRKTTEELGE